MNELIKVVYDNDRPTVSGRELHDKLEIKTAYKDWFPRMCEYGFVEGEDYGSFLSDRSDGLPGKPRTDHQLTLEMAKQICMIQRTEAGKRYREYFLEIEKMWNSPEYVMARAVKMSDRKIALLSGQLAEANKQIEEAKPKIEYYDTIASSEGLTSIRETAKLFDVREKDFKALLLATYLYRDAHKRMMPRAEYMNENAAFAVCETVITTPVGSRTTVYTKITPRGRQLLHAACRKKGLIK
nr:MAG TPA: AntA/AntB antirepressor [Caudoviricetes sp.]